jgi:hypothetical protein
MNYSRVALLFALVLASQAAGAWVTENSPLTNGVPSLAVVRHRTDGFQEIARWLSDKPAANIELPCEIRFVGPFYGRYADKNSPSLFGIRLVNAEMKGTLQSTGRVQPASTISQRLATVFRHDISLLKTGVQAAFGYGFRAWQQVATCYRETNLQGDEIRLAFSDFTGELSRTSPVRARRAAGSGFWRQDWVEYLVAGYAPRSSPAGALRSASYKQYQSRRGDETLGHIPSLTEWIALQAEQPQPNSNGAFRNISQQFAQLDWTTPRQGHPLDRTMKNATMPQEAIER